MKDRIATFGVDVDPDVYRRDILPELADVEMVAVMEATGYSKRFAP